MVVIPAGDDESRNWNPLDTFWRILYPIFSPRGDATPTRFSKTSPIWDLPSPYGKVDHPENKDSIPYFAAPDYFTKLYTEPKFSVVHYDPPVWMTVQNFRASDMLWYFPVATASGPAFSYAMASMKGKPVPSLFTLAATAVVGASLGFTLCYRNSENRLQGYAENSSDVQYWTQMAERERKIASGEIVPRVDGTWLQRTLIAWFGPKPVDLNKSETDYFKGKDGK